ncbi:MAG: 1-phosphofructokinase family hexose kinase [Burkholderiaceae bacterium]|nr:1-phosphofructokinase family hexose kinase [Burkholderiaceae bacterium]
MPDILTLTMNPALDVSTQIDHVEPTHKMRCAPAQQHPGGGGINVARVVHRLGGSVLAVFPSGGHCGQRLQELVAKEEVPYRPFPIAQETRESFSVHENSSGREFRFVLPGPTLSATETTQCMDALYSLGAPGATWVASGSLPLGVGEDFYANLAREARVRGRLLILDTSGPPLRAALKEGVYMVKPSLREMRELTGHALETEAQQLQSARQLVTAGLARIVALSLGEAGAIVVTRDHALRARSLPVPAKSTIGAGDSFVGGFVWALDRAIASAELSAPSLQKALRYGIAASAAALRSYGTALCVAADVHLLAADVQITAVQPKL